MTHPIKNELAACECGHPWHNHTVFSGCMVVGCWCHLPNPEDVRIYVPDAEKQDEPL